MRFLRDEFDFDYLVKQNIILSHFPVHSPNRSAINKSWKEYWFRLSLGMLISTFEDNMQPLNVIKDYYGEKEAFHFAWMIHYTGWLIPPSIVGFIFGVTMMISGA